MFRATTFLLVTMYTYTGKYLFITFATEILWSKLDIVTCKKKKGYRHVFSKTAKIVLQNVSMYMNETFAASCFVYKHTTFERQISVTNATSQPPATVNSPLSWAQCFQECHFLPHCQSLSLEGNVCSLYTSGGHPGSNVFSVVSSTIYSNRQGTCSLLTTASVTDTVFNAFPALVNAPR